MNWRILCGSQTALLVVAVAALLTADDIPALPNPKLTPGAVVEVPRAKLCEKGYARSVRHVSGHTKRAVYIQYGIKSHKGGKYEVDHLIPLELGGSNDLKNLWPQAYSGEWNAHVKDALEGRLHKMVCEANPAITLNDAQEGIRTDWIMLYQKIFKTEIPTK
jgi:hypothetical protein